MIVLKNVSKSYVSGGRLKKIIRNVSLKIKKGEFVLLIGESGAGKSTILNLICTLETPDEGKIRISNVRTTDLNENQLSDFRKDNLGLVFQFYNLIPNLTVRENVELVARMSPDSYSAEYVLKRVNLEKKMDSFPYELSGGEQQRVAIARAIVKKPKILLCDEPTGALDKKNGKMIIDLIRNIAREEKITVVMVTHNNNLKSIADKVYVISDGMITKKIRYKASKDTL